MKLFERFQRWASAMDDIEDSRGAEMHRLWERLRAWEDRRSGPSTNGKRDVL